MTSQLLWPCVDCGTMCDAERPRCARCQRKEHLKMAAAVGGLILCIIIALLIDIP